MQAIRFGGRFIEVFLKMAKVWRSVVAGSGDEVCMFNQLAHDMQRGTRTMQILCSEAKSKKELGMVAKVRYLVSSCLAPLCIALNGQRWT